MLRYLGASAKRVRGRLASAEHLSHLDLVHDGWLAWREARLEGRPLATCYQVAESRMVTCVERERRAARPWAIDRSPSCRRLTPGEWRDVHAWLNRELSNAPRQLETMRLLFHGRSIDEVARELHIGRNRAFELRAQAIRRLTASFTCASLGLE